MKMNKIKVIHILHELKFSGAEIMYVDAANVFQENGCLLSVVATANNLGEFAPYFLEKGYKIYHKPYPALKNYFKRLKYYFKFVQFLKKEQYDVVHIHSSKTMWGMSFCAWAAGLKSVYTFHNVFPTNIISYPYHILLRQSAKRIFNCKFQTISDSVYEHELKLYFNKTTKVYNWYGNNRFYPALENEKKTIRNLLNINQDTLVLISVGGCSTVKRHSDIIKALPFIIKQCSDVLYLHLGKGETETSEILLAEKLGVSQYIRFCNNQKDVRQYLIASDIYLMPSKFEGISITTIEAMACCIPAILYDVPGLRDFNKEYQTSILIPEDYKILAEKVCLLHKDIDLKNTIASSAKSNVDKHYNMQKNAIQIYNLYK